MAICMSLLLCQNVPDNNLDKSDVITTIQDVVAGTFEDITEESWKHCTEEKIWQTAKEYILKGWPDKKYLQELMPLYEVADVLELEEDLMYKGGKCVLPVGVQELILRLAHKTHPGMSAMKRLVRNYFWWPGLDRMVDRTVRECEECMSSEKMLSLNTPPLKCTVWPKESWKQVAFDISGPFKCLPHDSQFAFVLVDYPSRWPEVKYSSSSSTNAVIVFQRGFF